MLDIDGVMNTTSSCLRHRSGEVFTSDAVRSLHWLLAQTPARIVITSTRRRAGLVAMKRLLAGNGLSVAAARIVGLTPILLDRDSDELREDEIASWLDQNPHNGPLAILDDKPLSGPFARYLVLTDSNQGLTIAHALRAARLISD